jgi:hypothetical protein
VFNSTDYASQTYTFNYVVSDGCAVDQATSTVTVYAAPSAGTDGSITVCLNEPFVLWNGLSGNIDANGTWYNANNTALTAAQDTSGNLAGQFNYDYIVTSPVCPSDTSNVLVIVDGSCDYTASIDENQMGLSMYPNPTSGLLYIAKSQIGAACVEVLDLNGKVLQTNLLHQELMIDLSTYQKGMYVIKVQMNGVNIIERIAVQ